MKRLAALGLIISLTFIVGCGRKTPAVPPQAVIAQAITDLRCQLDDQAVTLTWTQPRLSVKGAQIDTIRSFIVHKARIDVDDYCSGCPVVYTSKFEVDSREPGNTLTFRDTDLDAGYHYVYMVQSNSGWRILSKNSNRIDFSRRLALPPPTDVQIDIGDSTLALSWSPVRHHTNGSALKNLKYQVYRSLDNSNFKPLGLPVTGLATIDPSLTNGRTYFYQVRALVAEENIITLGPASTTVSGQPLDMTPPAPPTELLAVQRQEGIQLHWQASGDSDIGGYYISRQEAGGPWQRIATTEASTISYIDQSDLPAGTYSYRINAFDTSERRNVSEPSQSISTKKP